MIVHLAKERLLVCEQLSTSRFWCGMEHSLKPSECCAPALNCSESLGGNEPAGVEYLGPHFTSMKGQNHSVIYCVIYNVVGPRHKACLC